MSLNIQTATGLLKVSGQVTKEKVVSALGYTPANAEVETTMTYHTSNTDVHISASERTLWNENVENLDSHISDTNVHITDIERTAWNAKADKTYVDTELTQKANSGHTHDQYLEASDIESLATEEYVDQSIAEAIANENLSQYATDVDLNNHTSDTDVHLTDEERTAWNAKSDFSGSYNDLTDVPTDLATTTYVDTAIAHLVDSSPETLDTLNELAAALGDDPNFATTVTNSLAEKAKQSDLDSHVSNKSNPHNVTASQIGLGNVDNTSDTDKPISTAQQEALDVLQTALDNMSSNITNITSGEVVVAEAVHAESTDEATHAASADTATTATTATSATKATQDASGNVIATTYETKTDANAKLAEAKGYTDSKVSDLVGSAPETLNTLQEVAAAIQEHEDVVEALNNAIGNKVDKEAGKSLVANAEIEKLASVEENANYYVLPDDVVRDNSYVHTDNNYTAAEKTKLTTVEENANYYVLPNDVVHDDDYVHTDNNYTTAEKTKLSGIAYGTCSTEDTIVEKVVTVDNFSLNTGSRVAVKFTVTNTVSSPTLNVNSTGAKAIYYNGDVITAGYLKANKTYEFVYNGTQYDLVGNALIGECSTGQYGEIFNTYWGETVNIAQGAYSHAEGNYTAAHGESSHAEGYDTLAQGNYSHAEGFDTTASGDYSHSEGFDTTASGTSSHAEGQFTIAQGGFSHAEGHSTTASGDYSHAEGYDTTASGDYSHAEGQYTIAQGASSHAGGVHTIANDYQYVVGRYNKDTTAPTSVTDTATSTGLFIVGIGSSEAARSNGFRVSAGGKVYGTGVFGTSGADYAEYFEWFDGNPNNEDRRGHFVTLDGGKIRYATSNDDYILGVVSANPSVAGDIHSESWHDMYLKDIYGSKIVEVVEVEETTNENGEIIPAHTERRWVLNPDYNPDVKYVSREERPEWAAIGIVGKLVVVDDGTCQVNGYCYPNANGIATASQAKTNYRVMERLDDTHIRIFIR